MPLYACDRCGFTSAAFRADAAAAHRLGYPDCDGVIRIVFRSHDRYRGPGYEAAPVGGRPAHARPAEARERRRSEASSGQPGRSFEIREELQGDETRRLILLGDLDLAVVETLGRRLSELKAAGRPVRLDLSRVAFIDSAGVQALLVALLDARWSGWPLDVARELSPSVERAAEIVGIAQVLWPKDPDTNRNRATFRPATQ